MADFCDMKKTATRTTTYFFERILIFILMTLMTAPLQAQHQDSTDRFHSRLPEITVVGRNSQKDVLQLPEIVGTSIYAGKKNALIVLDNVKGNTVTNTMRQVAAKVPGIHVWESDGSGIQIGISARGLSPNRSWEFNVRQNGYDIAADPFGYPEAYYNPQLQSVQRIEIVRGQGALQYGPQFGGLVNYILRNGSEINKPIQVEVQQTAGSNQLVNSYLAIGGESSRFHYYTFFDHRSAEGWRQNSTYFTNSGFGTFTWKLRPQFSLTAEIMRSKIRSQQPGGLTDQQFATDARQSLRSRNWMDIGWTTAALIANYEINTSSRLNVKLFTVLGDRTSVGYLRTITIADSINTATLAYANRTVDIDRYRNYGLEARYIGDFSWGSRKHTFSSGVRLYTGNTYRFRDGKGTTGSGYDATVVDGVWPRDMDFGSRNAAFFAEQLFRVTEKLLVIPGLRYETLWASASGINGSEANGSPIYLQQLKRSRSFLLAGIGMEYHVNGQMEFYGNITQAYRPIQFADLTAPPTTDLVDPNLKDATGYNADFGFRGKLRQFLVFDISAFYLRYNNRIGTITQQRLDGSFYNYRTNVGNSSSKGLEAFVEFYPLNTFVSNGNAFDGSLFVSWGYTDARYGNFTVISKNSSNQLVESNLKNKRVENAPLHILRSGATLSYCWVSLTTQVSSVSGTFADANNTLAPAANGQNGWIPAYQVVDLTAVVTVSKKLSFKAGLNNISDKRYFTRRAGGYPGPGLLPADGRSFFVTVLAMF